MVNDRIDKRAPLEALVVAYGEGIFFLIALLGTVICFYIIARHGLTAREQS